MTKAVHAVMSDEVVKMTDVNGRGRTGRGGALPKDSRLKYRC